MDIIVEPSEYRFLNAGDSAMTQVAISRLCAMWPEAHIRVLTNHPELLPPYSARVVPLSDTGRVLWSKETRVPARFARSQVRTIQSWSRALPIQQPGIFRSLRRLRYRHRDPGQRDKIETFLSVMSNAELFVVAGMGGLTSAFHDYSVMVLDTLALAQAHKVPTVLFGQGIGPFDPGLRKQAKRVLRKVDYITLREGRYGPSLLCEWGVPKDRWSVTGDDAIELAFRNHGESTGSAIGVNLRLAAYSAVTESIASNLREPLQQVARSLGAPLRAVPISRLPDEADALQAEILFQGYDLVEYPDSPIDTPLGVIEDLKHCRLVLTGSYHAGVFALAQGIPVIGLAASEYYQWKFDGLAHQFGDGCRVLRLGTPSTSRVLQEMIGELWNKAPDLRAALLSAAQLQRDASRDAYHHVFAMLAKRPAGDR
jgi:polysaccharide pyruvyl transferase WcaK-like protein